LNDTVAVIYYYAPAVHEFVVVGTEAQHISLDVRAIVWSSKGFYVGILRIWAGGTIKASTTNLTGEVIFFLQLLSQNRIPYLLVGCEGCSPNGATFCRFNNSGLVNTLKAVTPNPIPIDSSIWPIAYN